MSQAQHHGPGEQGDWPEQLAVRIAWCYYVLGLTQQEVAGRLGITRMRVNRLLAEARRRGVVRISITSELAENVELEERLKSRYGLEGARVVLAEGSDHDIADIVGSATADVLAERLFSGHTIGLGWGRTLKAFAEAMPERRIAGSSVVAVLGSLTRRSSIDSFEATTTLARKLDAECFYMPGPLICDTKAGRETLARQPMMKDLRERARAADIAVLSTGGVDSSTLREVGLIDEAEFESVRSAGAIGNFLGLYIDACAKPIEHPVNERVLGLPLDEMATIPERVLSSAGPTKVPALRAILKAGLVSEIVTDQASARAILEGDLP